MTGGVMKHVILSITPVQEFVGQARRTRDLWAGSYLLSWLSAQAMAAVKEAGGEIVMPQVDDDPMIRLLIHRNGVTPPVVGSLPNQFTARLPVGVGPEICREAVQDAWGKLAEAVWCKFVKPVKELSNFPDLSAVWTQQIKGFWEIAWVVVPPVDGEDERQTLKRAGDLLRRRKLWRSHLLPDDRTLLAGCEAALEAGIVLLQYRDKSASARERLRQATELQAVCRNAGVPLIINDDPELARRVGAAAEAGEADAQGRGADQRFVRRGERARAALHRERAREALRRERA